MSILAPPAIRLIMAIGIGLLIGTERERRKGTGPERGPAGIRTFSLACFAGALTGYLQSEALLLVVAAGAMVFSAVAYRSGAPKDPGLTSEFALIVTVLLGALTMQSPSLAAGLSVAGSCSQTYPHRIRDQHGNKSCRCLQRWWPQLGAKNPARPHRGRTGSFCRDVVRSKIT